MKLPTITKAGALTVALALFSLPSAATTFKQYVAALDSCNNSYEYKSSTWIACYASAAGERLLQQLKLFGAFAFAPDSPNSASPLTVTPGSASSFSFGQLDANGSFVASSAAVNVFAAPISEVVNVPFGQVGWNPLGSFSAASDRWDIAVPAGLSSSTDAEPYVLVLSTSSSLRNVDPDAPGFGSAVLAAVPEPNSVLLFGGGLLCLYLRRKNIGQALSGAACRASRTVR